jgi:hypothetical protein
MAASVLFRHLLATAIACSGDSGLVKKVSSFHAQA